MARILSSVTRLGWAAYLGKRDTLEYVNVLGRNVRVQDFWVPAAEALNLALIANGYENPCDNIGSFYPRYISGTDLWSWHSYGGPLDIDYGGNNEDSPDHSGIDRNPYLRTRIYAGFGTDSRFQINETQVLAVLAIRTNNGKRVWRWLGYPIGDTMHFEPNCSPADIATGIDPATVPEGVITTPTPKTETTPIPIPSGGTNMNYVKYRDGFGTTNGDADVKYWQCLLIDGLGKDTGGKDGKYGSKMIASVKSVCGGTGNQIGPAEAAAIHLALRQPSQAAAPAVDLTGYLKRGDLTGYVKRGDTVKLT